MPTKVIVCANQKGGVGKTTTAVNLAHGLAKKGKGVLLIDLDPQGNCATSLGMQPEPGAFYLITMGQTAQDTAYIRQYVRNTGRENMWLIAGDRQTIAAQMILQSMDRPISAIRDTLGRFLRNGLDYVLLDTSPSLGGLQERALWAADLVMIPTAADYLSTDGVRQLHETLVTLRNQKGWTGALLGVLPTFVEEQTREHKAGMDDLKEVFGKQLLPVIHKATTLRECPGMGLTIFEKDPNSRAAQEYADLVKLVMRY